MDGVAHSWEPITDLPPDWARLASAELGGLLAVWLEQKDLLAESEALREFNDRLNREWAIETGLIERIYTLDRGVTELLIEHGIDASLIPHGATDRDPELVVSIIRDQHEAVEWLFEVVRGERPLSISFVKELHALMTRHQATAAGRDQFGSQVEVLLIHGDWKLLPNNPTRPDGTVHEYCPPEQVAHEMERLINLHRRHQAENVPPEVEAAWLHHRFAQIHPFQDGNGRVARALASLVMIQARAFPVVVTLAGRNPYLDALEQADAGNMSPLVALFVAEQKRAFVGALGLAHQVVAGRERVSQVITSISAIFAKRDAKTRQAWESAKGIADGLVDAARLRFDVLSQELEVAIRAHEPGARVTSDAAATGNKNAWWWERQTTRVAKEFGFFANWHDYKAWARLGLRATPPADVLLVFTSVGHEYRGVIGAGMCYFRREAADEGRREIVDFSVVSDELFQVNYKDDPEEVVERFRSWLERGLVVALGQWRQQLPG